MGEFFKNAFKDMKESAKAQHEVDKANFPEFVSGYFLFCILRTATISNAKLSPQHQNNNCR